MPLSPRMAWSYPSDGQDPWYEKFQDMVRQIDASAFASREDRHVQLMEGGNVSFTAASGVLDWSADLEILAGITGFSWVLEAQSVVLEDGDILYVDLVRAPTARTVLAPIITNQIPSSDRALFLAIRRDSRVYWRDGYVINDGDSTPLYEPGSGGAGGNTLQEAYDEGGPGAGRVILANSGAIQINGTGVVLDVNADVDISGKLTVGGLIDPTGLELVAQAVNPSGGSPATTLWIDSGTGHLMRGAVDVETSIGGSLDDAYDFGGPGLGRFIVADSGAIDISGTFGLLISGGNLSLNDNVPLQIGSGTDLSVVHDGSNTTATSATGNLIIDNTNVTGLTRFQLGTDDANTALQVLNDSGNVHFEIDGAGTAEFNTPLLFLGKDQAGSPTYDSGFIVERGTSANAGFFWDESADRFVMVGDTPEVGTTRGNVTINSYAGGRASKFAVTDYTTTPAFSVPEDVGDAFYTAVGNIGAGYVAGAFGTGVIPELYFYRARGDTTAPADVAINDRLLGINVNPWASGGWASGFAINVDVSAAPSGAIVPMKLDFINKGVTDMSLSDDGYLGVGAPRPQTRLSVSETGGVDPASALIPANTDLTLYKNGFTGGAPGMGVIFSELGTPALGAAYRGIRSRGTVAAPAIVVSGDHIMSVEAYAYDGAALQNTANIRFEVDGAPSAGNMPTRILFQTGPAATPITRMTIDSSGGVDIPGKLTVGGLIDPTGMVFDEQSTVPGGAPGAAKGTLWVRDDTPNVLVFTDDSGSDTVLGAGGGGLPHTLAAGANTVLTDGAQTWFTANTTTGDVVCGNTTDNPATLFSGTGLVQFGDDTTTARDQAVRFISGTGALKARTTLTLNTTVGGLNAITEIDSGGGYAQANGVFAVGDPNLAGGGAEASVILYGRAGGSNQSVDLRYEDTNDRFEIVHAGNSSTTFGAIPLTGGTGIENTGLVTGANFAQAFEMKEEEVTGLSGATVDTLTTMLPTDCVAWRAAVYVTTTITGATSFDVGIAGDTQRYAAGVGVASGSTGGTSRLDVYSSGSAIRLTAQGGSFTAGAVRVVTWYLRATDPTA